MPIGNMQEDKKPSEIQGTIFNIQDYCIHDGPGIRTTVFFKGCSLHCKWCSNPESIDERPELGFIKAKCTKCGKCVITCEHGAITLEADKSPIIDRQHCRQCGKCVSACIAGALAMYGREITVSELYEEVSRDDIFYRGSGGGVTISGGEPLKQPLLVSAFFQLCRRGGIHTAIETSGHVAPQILREVLPLTNYVLFDLKHADSHIHKQYTGQPNSLILSNARLVVASRVPVLFRMPLVPQVNIDSSNIQATAAFLKELGKEAAQLELIPYHRLGMPKYEILGKSYPMKGVTPLKPNDIETIRRAFEKLGVYCTVSR